MVNFAQMEFAGINKTTTPISKNFLNFLLNISNCWSGWTEYNAGCYLKVVSSGDWYAAQSYCQSVNSNLVTINDGNEYNFLYNTLCPDVLVGSFWVGAIASAPYTFYWIDSSATIF